MKKNQFLKNFKILQSLLVVGVIFSSGCKEPTTISYDESSIERNDFGKWNKYSAHLLYEDHPYANYSDDHPERLTFDMYRPKEKEDEVLPLVIFLHSGAFVLGDKKNTIATKFVKDQVRTGEFAAASVNYRLIDHTSLNDLVNATALVSKGFTRHKVIEALGDVRNAMNHFIQNHEEYNIDPYRIYVMGFSAGAMLTNLLVFTDEKEIADYTNEFLSDRIINEGLQALGMKPLNHIDNEQAFNYDFSQNIKGIISMSGAVMDQNMLDDFEQSELPMLFIHGEKDQIVPYGEDKPFALYRNGLEEYSTTEINMSIGLTSEDSGLQLHLNGKYSHKFMSFLLDLFVSEICGSGCIQDHARGYDHLEFLKVKNGPHVFMMNKQGRFSKTYLKSRNRVYKFLKRNR